MQRATFFLGLCDKREEKQISSLTWETVSWKLKEKQSVEGLKSERERKREMKQPCSCLLFLRFGITGLKNNPNRRTKAVPTRAVKPHNSTMMEGWINMQTVATFTTTPPPHTRSSFRSFQPCDCQQQLRIACYIKHERFKICCCWAEETAQNKNRHLHKVSKVCGHWILREKGLQLLHVALPPPPWQFDANGSCVVCGLYCIYFFFFD